MAITTNVPAPTFGPLGFVAPPETAILPAVQADIDAAFGGDLNPALETPQGQLASSETACLGAANDAFLFLTSQFDPAYAVGRYQDALARIYFIERNPAQPTTVSCLCTGLQGVVIPAGAKAADAANNLYICATTGIIGADGMVTLSFVAVLPGPTPCPAGTLTVIFQSIPGWDTITNPVDGVLGNVVESRAAFEARRSASVAHNSNGSLPSVLGAVLTVPNVIDAFVTENVEQVVQTIGGVPLAANSIFVAVAGGDPAAIARAIWSKKAPGCAYNPGTTVQVQDDRSGYTAPYPTYPVTFCIPDPLDIFFAVTIRNTVLVPSNVAALVQAAIINAFAGGDGGPRARIGAMILASRFYCPIGALGPWAQIVSLTIGTTAAGATLNEVVVNINQIPAIAAGNIAVTLG